MYMYMVNLVVQYKVKTYITDFIFKHDAQRLSQSLVHYSKTQACQKWKGGKWMAFLTRKFFNIHIKFS